MTFSPVRAGYFGKLPAQADFVRGGLAEDFVASWDGWCRHMLAASRAALGDGWLAAWLEAPIWRFSLPAGTCGAAAALGVWLPSADKLGRAFPFAVCALAASPTALAAGGAWLAAAEAAGLAAVVEDAPHQNLAARLAAPVPDAPLPDAGWWTEGGPRVAPRRLDIHGLPPREIAPDMLRDPAFADQG